ncbi:hypothetical protein [Phenylobacterium sp.]|jgi:hypothetical protein|uniref:hypothetical protein n=1 Tax=Phenylobacterium sp. TaxID=1871053 RepID=UPI002E368E99|nr:hypothetical protein [Phenylobacterium sp.]HEX2560820.1 hypothetical protein [Phenylobacterium sp.]
MPQWTRYGPVAAGLLALISAACAPSLGAYRFERVDMVARGAIDAPADFEPKTAPHPAYLRVHFSSEANLNTLAETREAIEARADLCPFKNPQGVAVLGPYAVGQALAIRARTPEGGAAPGLARVLERDENGRYAYTAYVVPARSGGTDKAYDLTAEPRDLCLALEAPRTSGKPERSNVFVAPAAAIRAALGR